MLFIINSLPRKKKKSNQVVLYFTDASEPRRGLRIAKFDQQRRLEGSEVRSLAR